MLLGLCDAHVHPLDDVGVLHAAVNVEREKRAPNHSAELVAERRLAASGLAWEKHSHKHIQKHDDIRVKYDYYRDERYTATISTLFIPSIDLNARPDT